jgi:acyl carrier protein
MESHEEVVNILHHYAREDVITAETRIDELGIDSLNMIRSIIDFEKLFNINFEVEKLSQDSFIVVNDLVEYIREKIGEKK